MQFVIATLSVWLLLVASVQAWDNEPSGGEAGSAMPSPGPSTPAPTAAPSAGCAEGQILHPDFYCVYPKQICADDSTLYCASSIEACVGVNEIFKIPICTTQCEPGQVRLGADTEPAVAQDICVDPKLICPNKQYVCGDLQYSTYGYGGASSSTTYERCDENNACLCAQGTVASPLDGHYDAYGNPVCVDVKNKCDDGTICPANTAGCKDNACYCQDGYKLMPDGQCIDELMICENGSVCNNGVFTGCTDNKCVCNSGQAYYTDDKGEATCVDPKIACFDDKGFVYKVCTDVLDSVCTKGECGCKAGYVATSKKVYPDNLSTEPVDFGSACVPKVAVCNTDKYAEVNKVCGYLSGSNLQHCTGGQCVCPDKQSLTPVGYGSEQCLETCGSKDGVPVVCSFGAVCATQSDGTEACKCFYEAELKQCPVNTKYNLVGSYCKGSTGYVGGSSSDAAPDTTATTAPDDEYTLVCGEGGYGAIPTSPQ